MGYCCAWVTVSAIIWVWVIDPEVAVTVMVEEPMGVPGYLLLLLPLPHPLSIVT